MQRIRTFWQSGWIGKVILGAVALMGLFTFCCVALVVIGLANPQPTAQMPSAIAIVSVPTQIAPPTEVSASPTAPLTVPPTNTPEPTATDELPTAVPPTETPAPAATPVPVGYVSHEMLGDAWPLSVEEGIVSCETARRYILFRSGGVTYAVNGTARTIRGRQGWKDILDLRIPDPAIEGVFKNVQPIVDRGLALCQ